MVESQRIHETPAPEKPASDPADVEGLTGAQVAERTARGLVNTTTGATSRTVEEIVRANVLTRFNLLVGSLVAVVLVIGPIQDAVFGMVMVINSAVGIVQELRAKRALDELALVAGAKTAVIRDGESVEIEQYEVVMDDLVLLRRGDQVVVDGEIVQSSGLELDESLLTGESDPRPKEPGDTCLSGSAVLAGTGTMRTTRIGEEAYAAEITREARTFDLVGSELKAGTDVILRWVGWAIAPTAIILVWSQVRAAESWTEAARGAVAGTIGMVPQGLVLLISVALAVGVARLARMRVLTQELAAVEGLARVDTVCLDKTGTITEGRLRVKEVIPLGAAAIDEALAAIAHAEADPNATLRALAAAFPDPPEWRATRTVPFRSDRRWSAAEFEGHGTWVLGAPDRLGVPDELRGPIAENTTMGFRVLLFAASPEPLDRELPDRLEPRALIVIGDAVRSDARDTVGFFARQGVDLKVISGDHPTTVGAIAAEAGIGGEAISGSDLPDDAASLSEMAEATSVFGRIAPEQKRDLIRALQSRGHVVAMIGDGVNDVLALKAADVGIAMGSGAGAARAVAPLILVDGRFSSMPHIVAEGRRVIGNIERVASLYVTKTIYAFLLAWSVGIAGWAFPLLPRHYTVIGVITIGVPSFWLALEPTHLRATPGFVLRVLRFGLPIGVVTAFAGFCMFWVARAESVTLIEAQAVTTLTLVAVGLGVLMMVARPLTPVRKLIVAAMAFGAVLVFTIPGLRDFYALSLPRPVVVLAAAGVVSLTGALMYAALRASGWWRELPTALRDLESLALGSDVEGE
jgi:cation-transporting ATPase E